MTVTEDRDAALKLANETRRQRAQLRGELHRMPSAEARAVLADAITTSPDWLATAEIRKLLGWLPWVGDVRAKRWLRQAKLPEPRQLGNTTATQRTLLRELLLGTTSTTGSEGGDQ